MIRVVVCPDCKGKGFHRVRRYGDTPDTVFLCHNCKGERVVEEVVTKRAVSSATLDQLRAQRDREKG